MVYKGSLDTCSIEGVRW